MTTASTSSSASPVPCRWCVMWLSIFRITAVTLSTAQEKWCPWDESQTQCGGCRKAKTAVERYNKQDSALLTSTSTKICVHGWSSREERFPASLGEAWCYVCWLWSSKPQWCAANSGQYYLLLCSWQYISTSHTLLALPCNCRQNPLTLCRHMRW